MLTIPMPIIETVIGPIEHLSLLDAVPKLKTNKIYAFFNKESGLYEDHLISNTEMIEAKDRDFMSLSRYIPVTRQYSTFAFDDDMPEWSVASNLRWFLNTNTKIWHFPEAKRPELVEVVGKMAAEIYRRTGHYAGKLVYTRYSGGVAVYSPTNLTIQLIYNPATGTNRFAVVPNRSEAAMRASYFYEK